MKCNACGGALESGTLCDHCKERGRVYNRMRERVDVTDWVHPPAAASLDLMDTDEIPGRFVLRVCWTDQPPRLATLLVPLSRDELLELVDKAAALARSH